ncbi:MAG: discoidin domain-containing protein [Spirochaetales bacterium]|nr:discoidin domain-containing protein [Spirochaetales bacterium]
MCKKYFTLIVVFILCVTTIAVGQTNLALNRPATSSSNESAGYSAGMAFDGNTATRWSSAFSDPQWIRVDLGAVYSISRVALRWETACARTFQIQVSSDGNTWSSVYSTSSGTGGVNDLAVTGTGRYIRMYGTARATAWGYSLWEFEVYGSGGATPSMTNTPTPTSPAIATPTPTSPVSSGNLALNKPALSSSDESAGLAVNYAFDGDTGTRWASAFSDPQWIHVDLGAVYGISRVVLRWETACARSFEIQVSPDGNAWTSVYSTSSGSGGVNDLAVNGTGRYVRMYGTARATAWGYSLWEFEVYGSGGTSASPTRTMTPTVSTSYTTPSTATPTPTRSPAITPSRTPTSPAAATSTPTSLAIASLTPTSPVISGNLALNKPSLSSSNESTGLAANYAFDGNTGTRWASAFSDPQWIQVDLGAVYGISRVVLRWETAYASAFQVQVSGNGSSWTTVSLIANNAGGINDLPVSGSGRYVRMYGTVRATAWGYSLWEFEVYGSGGPTAGPTATLLPTVTPTNSPSGTPVYTPSGNGTFPMIFQNNTRGYFSDSQIFVLYFGMNASDQWCYLEPDGRMIPVNPDDANAPGHLTKNGVNYADYSFTLAQSNHAVIPAWFTGGRCYISLGSPMYIPIGNNAWGGPDLLNPLDPNSDVYYDWYEFTYIYNQVPFGGNTTQVDQFGFPMTVRLRQDLSGYDQTVGITLSRDEVFTRYSSGVNPAFAPLANAFRIVAPRSASSFRPGGTQENYMQAYIDEVWNYYSANQLTMTRLGQTFSGRVVNNRFQFIVSPAGSEGSGPFYLDKPTTLDVMACAGAFARAGMLTTELAFGAEFSAAFNRGVALNTADWYSPSAYYLDTWKNDYAMVFHQIGIDNRAYGFAYDDINDQSSVKILGNASPPTSITIGIGW